MKTKTLKLLDGPALIVAMVVDMILVGLGLWIIGPGIIEKVALCLLGAVAVLFAVRAWLKGGVLGIILWAILALSVFFLDLSFMMAATDPELDKPDTELIALEAKVSEADKNTEKLQNDYRAARTRATMDQLDAQIKAAQDVANGYRDDYRSRWISAQWGKVSSVKSEALSKSIYKALSSNDPGRLTFLVIFTLLFSGLQLTMIAAANETKKQDETEQKEAEKSKTVDIVHHVYPPKMNRSDQNRSEQPRPRIADPVSRWIGVEWNYFRNGRGLAPLKKESFYKATIKSPVPFPEDLWDRIMAAAIKSGAVKDGMIAEADEVKAAEMIRAELAKLKE